ncbi:MAG TPA: hypothetical protein VFV73_19055 [Streptosporangiaceae bacterium]|nr:hypothetical protein [Streptosporangiaceae bacterium]
MTIVDVPRPVTGGMDTHLDLNVAAALDPVGLLEVAEFPATSGGHRRFLDWLTGRPAAGPASRPAGCHRGVPAALSGRASGAARTRDGNAEAIRALVVAKRSARSAKIKTLNQIRHLSFTTPDQLRERLKGVSRQQLAARAAALRPSGREGADPVMAAAKTALRILGRRVLALDEEKARIDALLSALVTQTAPELLRLHGVGTGTAATPGR